MQLSEDCKVGLESCQRRILGAAEKIPSLRFDVRDSPASIFEVVTGLYLMFEIK